MHVTCNITCTIVISANTFEFRHICYMAWLSHHSTKNRNIYNNKAISSPSNDINIPRLPAGYIKKSINSSPLGK